MYSIAIPTKIPVKRANGNTIVVMNLEPLVTARAVNTIHTTNKVPYNIVNFLSDKMSETCSKLNLLKSILSLRLLSSLLDAANLSDLCGLAASFEITEPPLSLNMFLTNK